MFGLENKKKKPEEEFTFELEKELNELTKRKEIQGRVEKQLQTIKEMLRTGGNDSEEFKRVQSLLHGYNALVKVMDRAIVKIKK